MADVYVARQGGAGGFDKLVALKFLRDHGDDVGSRDMFKQELSTAALLNHPSIVQTFDAGEIDGRMYMAMEFINGETLSRFHRAVLKRSPVFPVELALHLVRELANALDYAHDLTTLDGEPLGLVHRDISPSNVLLSVDGGVKLLDFGIARVTTRLRATEVGVIKGKFAYMAPEQAAGEAIDRRADIYALGILLWQLVVGRQAFDAESDAALMHQVLHPKLAAPTALGFGTPELDAIVMRALAPKARDRYATAGALASDLSAYLAKLAPGYEGTKVIREYMAECFAEKREKLARAIKGLPEQELSFDEIDLLSGAQLHTPSPRVMFTPAREPSAEISVIRGEHPPAPRPRKRRSPALWLAAAVALAAPAVIAWKLFIDRPAAEPSTPPQGAAPATAPAATDSAASPSGGTSATQQRGDSVAVGAGAQQRGDSVGGTQQRGDSLAVGAAQQRTDAGAAGAAQQRPDVGAVGAAQQRTDSIAAAATSRNAMPTPESGPARTTKRPAPAPPKRAASSRDGAKLAKESARDAAKQAELARDAAKQAGEPTKTTPGAATPPAITTTTRGADLAARGTETAPAAPRGTEPAKPLGPDSAARPMPAPPGPGSLDATVAIASITVDGPLPDSEIRSAVDRNLGAFRECYRAAAKRANRTPLLKIKLAFGIDESRAAQNLRVSGDTLGAAACIQDAASRLRTRVAPDVGTAGVSVVIKFSPVGG